MERGFRYLSSVALGNWANVSEFQNSYRPEFSFNNQVIIHHIHLLPCFCRFGSFLVCSSNLFFHVYRNYHYSCRSLRIKFFFKRKREVGLYEDREAYFANFSEKLVYSIYKNVIEIYLQRIDRILIIIQGYNNFSDRWQNVSYIFLKLVKIHMQG